jgi:hypothetical protein
MSARHSTIFVRAMLDSQRSAALIEQHRRSLQDLKQTAARQSLLEALWAGQWMLIKDAEECAEQARVRGQLLFCWHGTTLPTEGAAC